MSDRSYIAVSENTTAKNALCLDGEPAGTYAPLTTPSFVTCITTPVIKITTGAATGCVLTSGADGTASWTTPSGGGSITGGTNGLGYSGENICLGGALTSNTYIATNTRNLFITGGTYGLGLAVKPNDACIGYSNHYLKFATSPYDYSLIFHNNSICSSNIFQTTCEACITSSDLSKGSQYYTNITVHPDIIYLSAWSGLTCSSISVTATGTIVGSNYLSGNANGTLVCVIGGSGCRSTTTGNTYGGNVYVSGGLGCSPTGTSRGGCVNICGGCATGTTHGYGGALYLCAGSGRITTVPAGYCESTAAGGSVVIRAGAGYGLCGDTPEKYVVGGGVSISGGESCVLSGSSFGGGVSIYGGCGRGNANSVYETCGGDVCFVGGSGWGYGGSAQLWGGSADCLCNGGNVILRGGYSKLKYGGSVSICSGTGPSGSTVYIYSDGNLKLNTVATGVCITDCGFATDFISSSDRRLKTDIQSISNALSIVTQLEGVSYRLCDDCMCEKQLGLIAQDVINILPEIVSHTIPSENDVKYGITDDKLGIKYDKLTAVLIEAVKELEKKVQSLELEIKRIKIC